MSCKLPTTLFDNWILQGSTSPLLAQWNSSRPSFSRLEASPQLTVSNECNVLAGEQSFFFSRINSIATSAPQVFMFLQSCCMKCLYYLRKDTTTLEFFAKAMLSEGRKYLFSYTTFSTDQIIAFQLSILIQYHFYGPLFHQCLL